MGLNREAVREEIEQVMRTGKGAEECAHYVKSVARCITRASDETLQRATETLMGRPVLQRESALIWMEDVAGYLLALAEIIQERQKERTYAQFSGIQNSHARTGVHVRSGRIQTAYSTILGNGEIIHARATERKSLCLESVRRTGPPAG